MNWIQCTEINSCQRTRTDTSASMQIDACTQRDYKYGYTEKMRDRNLEKESV